MLNINQSEADVCQKALQNQYDKHFEEPSVKESCPFLRLYSVN